MRNQSFNDIEPDAVLHKSRMNGAVDGASAAPAVCIAGMHRSGTSMVAQLLHTCGLFLGPEEDLPEPSLDNPHGYWENRQFVRLNENLISRLGGNWVEPPAIPSGWEFAPEITSVLAEAEKIIGRLRRHDHWGWKDPRNSLTIAFWRRVVPNLKVVICVRNPLEVAHSLFVRGDVTSASEFGAWAAHYRELLDAIPPEQRVVTHYQSYFQDAPAELRRVLSHIGLSASDETVDRACVGVSEKLRHHHGTTVDLIDAGATEEARDLYSRLCDEAGPICRQAQERERVVAPSQGASHDSPVQSVSYKIQLMQMEALLARNERKLQLLESRLDAYQTILQMHDQELTPLKLLTKALKAVKVRLSSAWGRKDA